MIHSMDYSISFPNLGIPFAHVGKELRIGPLTIAYYGICIALGMLLGITAVTRHAKETGQKADDYVDICVWTMVAAIAGARLYYVAFSFDESRNDLMGIFRIREGGLAIYGGLIAGVIAIFVLSHIKKISFRTILDTCVIGVPIGQIIGRWGNFFNREAFGDYTDNLFAMRLPVSAVRANEITARMWDNVVTENGVQFIQAHPTFLYEGVWNLLVLLVLFLMRKKTVFPGELFLIYLTGYGTGRFFIEMLRTDQLLIPGTQMPVSMVVSAGAAVVSLIIIVYGRIKYGREVRM